MPHAHLNRVHPEVQAISLPALGIVTHMASGVGALRASVSDGMVFVSRFLKYFRIFGNSKQVENTCALSATGDHRHIANQTLASPSLTALMPPQGTPWGPLGHSQARLCTLLRPLVAGAAAAAEG